MTQNAFLDKPLAPTAGELAAVLGASHATWLQLTGELASECGVATQEWHSYSQRAGWSLRLKKGKRTILYVIPCEGRFHVAFALGQKAIEAARQAGLPQSILKTIDESTRYAEGTGVRLDVAGPEDIPAIRALALIKIAH